MHLAREHRIVGEPVHLRALDLAVPIGALDEPDHEPAAMAASERHEPVDHVPRALLVGLHDEAQALPVRERRVGGERLQDVERKIEPVRFLGVDR